MGASAAFDDRDFKPPTTTVSHPLNYQFPGRVLLLAGDRYYSFRDTAFPEHGGLAGIEADYVAGSGDVRYLQYAAEFHRFFTLFYRDRILGIRVRLENAHALGEESLVPYSDMPTLGGGQRLRGYRRGFFRDQGSLLLSAEYRYPIWDTWNAFLFWEEGAGLREIRRPGSRRLRVQRLAPASACGPSAPSSSACASRTARKRRRSPASRWRRSSDRCRFFRVVSSSRV